MKHAILILLLLGVQHLSAQTHYHRKVDNVRNVIVMIPDGTSTSVLSLARWFQRYNNPELTELNIDDHLCGMVGSFSSNSLIPDSAPSMSAYMTGVPTSSGYISCYPAADPAQDLFEVDAALQNRPLATLLEAARHDRHMATGVVATCYFNHATPAATSSHACDRDDYDNLARQMAASGLDLVFGGGRKYLPEDARQELKAQGATIIEDVDTFRSYTTEGPLWALFADAQLDYEIDRDDALHPSLAEMTRRAIERLSVHPEGFFLMVEGSMIDWAAHGNDPATILHEMLAFDKAVGEAVNFARQDGNTLVVIMPDHGTSGFSIGNPEYHDYTRKGLEPAFGTVSKYRASIDRMERMVREADDSDISALFRTHTGIELTDKELQDIIASRHAREDDYMEVSNSVNLYSVISTIMKSRTPFGFVSGNHTGEDVFLAVYHPTGDTPRGRQTNSEINAYIAEALALPRTLQTVTDDIYAPHDELFMGSRCTIVKSEGAQPLLKVKRGRKSIEARANSSTIVVNKRPMQLRSVVVYIERNNKFYLPREVADMLL